MGESIIAFIRSIHLMPELVAVIISALPIIGLTAFVAIPNSSNRIPLYASKRPAFLAGLRYV
jgi:hypothetical protein